MSSIVRARREVTSQYKVQLLLRCQARRFELVDAIDALRYETTGEEAISNVLNALKRLAASNAVAEDVVNRFSQRA